MLSSVGQQRTVHSDRRPPVPLAEPLPRVDSILIDRQPGFGD